ncbi:MAG: polyprenol monophosphomannose synthase [Candidatus Marinimicrobia bacterium]|nr:polyprenol monophosphomannose synthase [Candidatus Neomarinimicrobiota bacterium]
MDKTNPALVIIPTYNEKNNIPLVIKKLIGFDVDILVIDDNSPDNTADVVREHQEEYKNRIYLIEREGKLGLGTAYIKGFKWALDHNYRFILEMDADLSHNPKDVPRLINKCKQGNDLVIGSRYCNGVNVVNWPLKRLIISYLGSRYARFVTRLPIQDPTAGFKCFHNKVLESIELDNVRSTGYAFQIEMNYRAYKKGFKLHEIPIIFTERTEGESKMSKQIVYEAVFMVWKLVILNFIGRL